MKRAVVVAYACEPNSGGGEPAVGWEYVSEAARRFEHVSVVTKANNVPRVRSAVPGNVTVYGVEPGKMWGRFKKGQRFIHAYYLAWQRAAAPLVRELTSIPGGAVLHHSTFATYALPPLCVLSAPPSTHIILGPGGGTASIPWRLAWKILPARDLVREIIRELNIRRVIRSRTLQRCLVEADEVFVSSPHERINSPKSVYTTQASINESEVLSTPMPAVMKSAGDALELIMVGRVEHFKGYRLALDAIRDRAEWNLTIVGEGKAMLALTRYAQKLNVAHRVRFSGQLARTDLFAQLRNSDVFVSTSLRESGPLSVAEASAAGLPVAYLDVGAIEMLVPRTARRKVARDLTYRETVAELVRAIEECAVMRNRPPDGDHWRQLSWPARGDFVYRNALAQEGATDGDN